MVFHPAAESNQGLTLAATRPDQAPCRRHDRRIATLARRAQSVEHGGVQRTASLSPSSSPALQGGISRHF